MIYSDENGYVIDRDNQYSEDCDEYEEIDFFQSRKKIPVTLHIDKVVRRTKNETS